MNIPRYMVTKAFSLLLCCYEAVSEAVPRGCCVATKGEVNQLVTLVSLLVIDRAGLLANNADLPSINTQKYKRSKMRSKIQLFIDIGYHTLKPWI